MKTISTRFLETILSLALLALPMTISAQSNKDGSMPQYLFESFSEADIKMKDGQIQNQAMNYNTITGKMVFTKGDKFYDLTNPEMVDTVTLDGCKFVPVGKDFYEVITKGVYSLYIQHAATLTQPGKPVGYGGTSQLSASNYVSTANLTGLQWNLALPSDFVVNPSPVYWIRKGTDWSDFTTVSQLLKLFPDKSAKMKEYIKSNKIRADKADSMAKLIEYLNTL